MSDIPKYTMHFEPLTIEHLGSKMYSRIGPAIAELVSNSWDADVDKVEINFTEKPPLIVTVRDFGGGMSPKELQSSYLPIGRYCRSELGKEFTAKGRPIMGRKGIGKLSAFGIANQLEIRTIKNNFSVCIRLDYDKMKSWPPEKGDYEPELIAERTGETKEQDGTEVTLKNLHRRTKIESEIVKKELAKKFSIITKDDFKVYVNGDLITVSDRLLRDKCILSWNVEDLPMKNIISPYENWSVAGWIGFLNESSQVNRGIDIFVRGKSAENNSMFNLASSSNLVGRAYLVGEIHADFLDTDDGDFVNSARDSVRWESPPGELLEKWGQEVIKFVLLEWIKNQHKEKEQKLFKIDGFDEWYIIRSKKEQAAIQKLIKIIVSDTKIESGSAGPLLEMIKSNIEFEAFQNLVDEIEESGGNIQMFKTLVEDWEIIEAREHLKLSDGRMEIIKQLNQYMIDGALEVQEIQPLFEKNGWLVNPAWGTVTGQKRYSDLLRENCLEPNDILEPDRRLDIIGYDAGGMMHIVELKRPEKTLSLKDLNQIEEYRDWANNNVVGTGEDSPIGVTALLLVGKLSKNAELKDKMTRLAGDNIRVQTYSDIIKRAENIYGEVEKRLKNIAPEYSREARKKRKKQTQQ